VDDADAEGAVHAAVTDAVRRQMRSDVPVGILLSGGVDSTIVATVAADATEQPINTFSIGFEAGLADAGGSLNADADTARRLASELRSHHHEIVLRDDSSLPALIERLAVGLDEPTWEPSFASIFAIARAARDADVKVVLSGDGSDELFLGYPWHVPGRLDGVDHVPGLRPAASIVSRVLPRRTTLREHATNLREVAGTSDAIRYRWTHRIFGPDERRRLLPTSGAPKGADPVVGFLERMATPAVDAPIGVRMAHLDLSLWVRDHFNQRLDRMTMLSSVESRVPFQDNVVVDLAYRLSGGQRAPGGRPKALLKAAFADQLPGYVLQRPKRSFAAPMDAWLRGGLAPLFADVLSPEAIRAAGIVDPTALPSSTTAGAGEEEIRIRQSWVLLMLHLWHDGMARLSNGTRPSSST
jgi:asparagine synthase (glutamine-hydrolysing)